MSTEMKLIAMADRESVVRKGYDEIAEASLVSFCCCRSFYDYACFLQKGFLS
jgi:hypothetical protein